jgi:hypothetical protein
VNQRSEKGKRKERREHSVERQKTRKKFGNERNKGKRRRKKGEMAERLKATVC